ncbi:helix-turn-helix domain-containing protein [Streptomyces uncialis]|uniref:helix-turn-helix domain-containing protein n=1 Tax=Streptomyces uncialis TaxID=1048205 RepID=UPI003800B06A
MGDGLGDNVRDYRRAAGWTQEELAHAAGLSASVVRKAEQGGNVRMETLHILARALGEETSALMASAPLEPREPDDGHTLRIMELRKALLPSIGFAVEEPAPDEVPRLAALREVARQVNRSYYGDAYGKLAADLPALIREADAAVRFYDSGPERAEALAVRVGVFRTVARYLTQVREHDLAYESLRRLLADGQALGSELDVASAASGMCWVLMGQGRFAESARLARDTADRIEPERISKAGDDHLAMWGWAHLRAVAGAVRNNQYDEAESSLRLARCAAGALGREVSGTYQGGVTFGPVTVAMAEVEVAVIKGDDRTVLDRADRETLGEKARRALGAPRPNSWFRHRMDVALAHQRLGRHQEATLELLDVRRKAPAWLSHQRAARDVMAGVHKGRKRSLTPEMREMGVFLGVR